MRKISFAIIGGGWRSTLFLQVVKQLPDLFDVCGMVVRNPEKAQALEATWGVKTYPHIDQLLNEQKPSFVLVCVAKPAAFGLTRDLAEQGIPVLSETPPAENLADLAVLDKLTRSGAKIQVAEQYHLQPLHAARLNLAASGKLGPVHEVQISVCHDYHAISLGRKFLKLGFENATITPYAFESPIAGAHSRPDKADSDAIVPFKQDMAMLNFGDRLLFYDFSGVQYFTWIRALRLLVQGERGEIYDEQIRYLLDDQSPVHLNLSRLSAGEKGNLDGYYFKGILAGSDWLYKNPFAPGRLSDDEIAMGSCLQKMHTYVNGGPEFYSLADAAQDHYLGLMIHKAIKQNQVIQTETQPWAR